MLGSMLFLLLINRFSGTQHCIIHLFFTFTQISDWLYVMAVSDFAIVDEQV